MTYTCNVCGVTSDAVEFYKGVTSRCKECHKERVRENRRAKVDYYRKYDAERYQSDPRVKKRHKRYAKTENGKKSLTRARKKWLENNEDKRAAHILLGNSLRNGRVHKPKNCEVCGSGGRIEGHHEDYSKPLDVMWLCRSCHVERHRQKEKEVN